MKHQNPVFFVWRADEIWTKCSPSDIILLIMIMCLYIYFPTAQNALHSDMHCSSCLFFRTHCFETCHGWSHSKLQATNPVNSPSHFCHATHMNVYRHKVLLCIMQVEKPHTQQMILSQSFSQIIAGKGNVRWIMPLHAVVYSTQPVCFMFHKWEHASLLYKHWLDL